MNELDRRVAGLLERTTGPNLMADKIRDTLDDIASELDGGGVPRARRSELNKRAHRLKDLLRWCETRAGYVAEG